MNRIAERERRLSGVPSGVARPWWQRLLRNPVFWLCLILLPLYVFFLLDQWVMFSTAQEFEDGTQTTPFTFQTLKIATGYALPTAAVYFGLFIWLDRFRAQRPLIWLLTFGWGAAAATWFSIYVNSWMGQHMATTDADADTGSRAAIFSAPFSEELSKATVLFLLVILMRRQIVSRLSLVSLAGLSAIGFAFVENIIYYGRALSYAISDASVENPQEALWELVMLRGVYTSFGHPLFTMFTATGLTVALAARSKLVRIFAPLVGFFAAVACHMVFNGLASLFQVSELFWQWIGSLIVVALIIVSLLISVVQQARLIGHRLGDFATQGWISVDQLRVFSASRRRLVYLLKAIFWGPKRWWYSAKLARLVTELAYLRSAQTRGQAGVGGAMRIRDLVELIDQTATKALSTGPDVRWLGWRKPKRKKAYSQVAPVQPHYMGGRYG